MTDAPPTRLMQSPPGADVIVDGQPYLYFGGTSYLGLAGRAEVIEAACEATRRYGIHTATSRSGYGTNPATLAVESLAARFFETETAFYFVSGYMGNHILVQAIEPFDLVAIEESAHFSSREAAKLAQKPIITFRGRDPDELRQELRQRLTPGQVPLVMIDGVCPTTGAVAPLPQIIDVLAGFPRGMMIVDDAHGVGVLGERGRGTLDHFGLWGPTVNCLGRAAGPSIYLSATLSKALGGFGGVLPLSLDFLQQVRRTSHYWEGASAPAAPVAGASARALEIVLAEPQLRTQVRQNSAKMRAALRGLGLTLDEWPTPVIGLSIGRADDMLRIQGQLQAAGILVPYFHSYAGVGPEGLLRIAIFATHTAEMIDRFVSELGKLL
jgi:8-amino-7-oxononanoate synthase